MKLSFGKSKLESEKIIVFMCVENAGRSEMAEGTFRVVEHLQIMVCHYQG